MNTIPFYSSIMQARRLAWNEFCRIYTCMYGKVSDVVKEEKSSVIAIGRVMTCVLGLVVDENRK